MDPLSSYDYSYNYHQVSNYNDMFNVKMEPLQAMHMHQPQSLPYNLPQYPYPVEYPVNKPVTEPEPQTTNTETPVEQEDTKEHIKLLEPNAKRKTKKKGKTSNYWNKKVEDKNFPFYGCTICNISFATIQDLDQHVTIHKGRITSYDIRVRNQIKRKEKLKLQKKLKKLGKLGKNIKLEDQIKKLEIEIKPEDGYIGNETAAEYNETTKDSNKNDSKEIPLTKEPDVTIEQSKETNENDTVPSETTSELKNDKKSLKKSKIPYKVPEDPRLMKLFKCFACEKQFSLSYYLKLHVRSHTDEKPYTCSECGQSFITASKLGRHNKRIHLAVRYQCRICFKTFYRFDILRRHFDKAHKEDKLEGEPYDYNAILPYLKELEEQLRENELKKEQTTKTEVQDIWGTNNVMDKGTKDGKSDDIWDNPCKETPKIESENAWGSNATPNNLTQENGTKNDPNTNIWFGDNPYIKEEDDDTKEQLPLENILVEEVKVDTGNVEVKVEVEVDAPDHQIDDHCDDFKDGGGGNSNSDEDYFPSNTWTATPKEEVKTATTQKKIKRSNFPYKCEFCDKMINTPSYYKVHLRTHSGERPFKCYICGKGFITSSKMHRHVLTHEEYWQNEGNNKEKVKSEDGESKLEDNDENKESKPKKRKSKKPKDPTLKKKRKSCTVLKKEYKKRPHACMYCKKRFLHLETLQVHQKCHEGEEIILKCYYCLETMPNEEELKSHEAQHIGNRPYLCTICGRNYTKRETMIYHRKQHDTGNSNEKRNDYICDVCSKIFFTQSKLQRHLASHRVDKFVLRYECPVCAHMFNTKYHIQMHLSTHQKEGLIVEENRNEILAMVLQNARKFPKKGDTSLSLTELVPSEERSTVCNICGEVFQHFYYLEEHLKSHGSKIAIEDDNKPEDKKHICPVCQKGFKLHYYLKLHSFTHTKLKPFICQQCGKGFITKGKLKRHLETHTGLKKYQCHICYKFFTRPSYLRIHVRTIHGTQDYNFRLDKQCLMVGQLDGFKNS